MFELLLATETSENLQVVLLAKRGRVNPRSCILSTAQTRPTTHATLCRDAASINRGDSLETQVFKPAVSFCRMHFCPDTSRPIRGQHWRVHRSRDFLGQSEARTRGSANFCKLAPGCTALAQNWDRCRVENNCVQNRGGWCLLGEICIVGFCRQQAIWAGWGVG